jgi:copper transport protein
VAAGSVWFGGIVGLMIVGLLRRRTEHSAAPLTVRFSSVATLALIAVTVAGVLMSLMITDGFGDYTGTDWGRALIIKTIAVGIAVLLGAYNHFVVVPALELDPDATAMQRRAQMTVSIEAIVLLFVAVATVFLTVASTN